MCNHRVNGSRLVRESRQLRQLVMRLEAIVAEQNRTEETLRNKLAWMNELLALKEQDRRLAAYDLHDGVAQTLAGAVLHLQAFANAHDRRSDEAEAALQRAMSLLARSLAEVRWLIRGIGPERVQAAGAVEALRTFVLETQKRENIDIEFVVDTPSDHLDPLFESVVFQIVHESVNNAVRHSRSNRVRVEINQVGNRLCARITDWGVGFAPDCIGEDSFGLRGMRERAKLVGGTLKVDTSPGSGTVVSACIPLNGQRPQARSEKFS